MTIEWDPRPEDMSPDDPHYECGESYDHDAVPATNGGGWVCQRCGAEGWEPEND